MTTQAERVVELLRERGPLGVTPLDALDEVGSFRLAARVHDAKQMIDPDEEIITERAQVGHSTVARYVLRRRVPAPVAQASLWE